MTTVSRFLVAAFCGVVLMACAEAQEDPVRVLFLSKSSGFEHSCIKEKDGEQGHVQKILHKMSSQYGAELTTTKDASLVNKENLKNYDLVVFYTTGILTKLGADKNPPMAETGPQELLDWISAGGAFMGFHCATDSFHSKGGEVSPYIEMIGGEFKDHGKQFEGTLKLVDPGHPAIANLPQGFTIKDEWYLFTNLNTEDMHVLALLELGDERANQEKYDVPDYPVIWCRAYGEGRVYQNAMGHREDVWENETFLLSVADAVQWVLGATELRAEPNYDKVVPTEKP